MSLRQTFKTLAGAPAWTTAVTNGRQSRDATQVYLEDIDFTPQAGEILQPYSKYHKHVFRCELNNDKFS